MKIFHQITAATGVALTLGVASLPARAAPFDQQFIDSITPHHQSALMMAQMAVTQAKYPEVRALARGIVADQKKEVAYMSQLRKRFYGGAMSDMNMKMAGKKMVMPGLMKGGKMMGEMDTSQLKSAKGTMFDRMFLKMMIPHHAGAIVMSEEALQVTARPEIRGLAMKIIDAQAKEIGDMHTIYDRRFGSLAKG